MEGQKKLLETKCLNDMWDLKFKGQTSIKFIKAKQGKKNSQQFWCVCIARSVD